MTKERQKVLQSRLSKGLGMVVADVEAGRAPAPRLISEITDLQHLLQISAREDTGARAYVLLSLLLVSLLISSGLIFTPRPHTTIELEARAIGVQFRTSREQLVVSSLRLSSIGVSDVKELIAPQHWLQPAVTAGAGAPGGVRLSTTTAAPGAISTGDLVLAAGSQITVERSPESHTMRLSLSPPPDLLSLYMNGRVELRTTAAEPARELALRSPQMVQLRGGAGGLQVDITPPPRQLVTDVLIDSLSFQSTQVLNGAGLGGTTITSEQSWLQAGHIYLDEIGGKVIEIRSGQQIDLDMDVGTLRAVITDDSSGVGVRFHGRVRKLTSGAGSTETNLMPSYLEWLEARHGLKLFWGTALYCFGLLTAALRWWSPRRTSHQ